MAATGDPVYAATKAGYPRPNNAGSHNANNAALADKVAEARRILLQEGALIGVRTLIECCSKLAPWGVRRAAGKDLVAFAGVGAAEGEGEKDPHSMTATEIDEMLTRLAERRELLIRAASDKAKPVIEAEAVEVPESGVFG